MTVVNFLCRREQPMIKKKAKRITAVGSIKNYAQNGLQSPKEHSVNPSSQF